MNVRWRFRACVVVAVCALCSLAAAGVAGSAPTVVPPPGTPDLSQMALQQSDFTATTVINEGYQSQPPFVAIYERDFGPSVTASGAGFSTVISGVFLASDAGTPVLFVSTLRTELSSPKVRAKFVQQLVASTGRQLRRKDIRMGRVRDLGIGDGAILLPIRLRIHGVRVDMDLLALRRDRVAGLLVVGGLPGKALNVADVSGLANTMVGHVNVGLSPQNTAPPTIAGTAAQGQTLVATTGSWTNNPTSFGYQWQRCSAAGASCQPISGATASTYTVTASDSGSTLRVAVSATNNVGPSAPVSSSPTTLIP